MTQRSNHPQTAPSRPLGQAIALRADARILALTRLAPLSAALILVLVLITGHASAEYGFV